MKDLDYLRGQIDAIDDQILDLLNKRAGFVLDVGHYKAEHGMELYVPSRESSIFNRLKARNKGPFPTPAIRKVFREIISASLSIEYPTEVVFLGPTASFTHIATLQQFGHSANLRPVKTIPFVFDEVTKDRAQFGIVPIENSTEGAVTHTLDMFRNSSLTIIAEIYLEVAHDLLSRSGKKAEVKRIYSHPQALAQCRQWLAENYSEVPLVETNSTAEAAQISSEDSGAAAVAGGLAANIYGLQVITSRIEDHHNNYTRFLVIGTTMPKPSGNDKTTIMFSFQDGAGVLCRMLEPFRKRNLNLMKIESRPQKEKAWEYLFFLDIEGHIQDIALTEAVEELKAMTTMLKVLGSYPRGR